MGRFSSNTAYIPLALRRLGTASSISIPGAGIGRVPACGRPSDTKSSAACWGMPTPAYRVPTGAIDWSGRHPLPKPWRELPRREPQNLVFRNRGGPRFWKSFSNQLKWERKLSGLLTGRVRDAASGRDRESSSTGHAAHTNACEQEDGGFFHCLKGLEVIL